MLNYFSADEFERARPACALSDMDSDFMSRLDLARGFSDVPYVINSAYRSRAYEISKGRFGTSSHTKGLAVDIACSSNFMRGRILYGLIKVGFSRIGIGKTFIHVDSDNEKSSAIWLY